MWVTEPFTEKLPESIESTKFAPHRAGVSGEFDSRKDSHPTKFAQRTWILVKLSFREFCDSKTSGLYAFNYTAISLNQKKGKFWKGRLWLNEDTEDSSVVSKWQPGPLGISTPPKNSWRVVTLPCVRCH